MYVLTDHKICNDSLSTLKDLGFSPILMPPFDSLEEAVSSHTDMLLFIGFDRLFCHADYYVCNKELIDRIASLTGFELTLSNEKSGKKYPHDVLFNACIMGHKLICNKKTVSKLILDSAMSANYEIINVSQGYTKCSVCPIGENALITSDKAIANACMTHGIEVLLISEGNVSLPPYDYGFIGGASGIHGANAYFCGSLDIHPDNVKIKMFCESNGIKVISLSNGPLQDVGSIFFI